MKATEIKTNVQNLIDKFSKEEFIYDLLIAYGISKTSVTRIKKGDYNSSKVDGEILYKKKIFFKVEATEQLLSSIEEIAKQEEITQHKPRFAILTDYKQIVAKDLKLGDNLDIELKELPNRFDFFLPLAGSEVYNATNDNEADREASYKMASLYDLLIEENPQIYKSKASIHNLNIFLSRLLFCFFAEDTEIFAEESVFTNMLAQHTVKNGSDTHSFLDELFERLNTEKAEKFPEYLRKFEYVNGGLFGQKVNSPKFNTKARKILIELGDLNWSEINPDIFGSMIQAVVNKEYRRDLGMHYTSVENILKLIKPLFLDELYQEFENASTIKQLNDLIQRISKIKFFDPACGSGNFLIITYKEIRLLEIKILQKIINLEKQSTFKWTSVQLSQFYGIEIDDFAHEMAILSLWLAEHQMNRIFEEMLFDYGKSKNILPLKEAGRITHGNATRVDWKKACPITKEDEVYIIGNPPYLGSSLLSLKQKKDLESVGLNHYNKLDYICAWFFKGANYIEKFNAKCSFVSTNSICQGEQVFLLWQQILKNKLEIDFAYQSFKWINNAKGNAGVTVIIVGLRNINNSKKYLFIDNYQTEVKNINNYLRNESNVVVNKLNNKNKIFNFPSPTRVSFISNSEALFLNSDEKNKHINNQNTKYIRKLIGAYEMLQGKDRYCIYINEDDLENAIKDNFIKERISLCSKNRGTEEYSYKFCKKQINEEFDYLVIPRVSSESRNYLPINLYKGKYAYSDSVQVLENPTPLIFAVITSRMHMVWVRAVGGKLKTDYRYSSTLCYNTFPFPEISDKQKLNLNEYVFSILEEREKHPSKTMAYLYNPDTMPKGLLKAHQELDTAIEQCYRLQPFKNDTERLAYLFNKYEEMTKKDTLFAKQKKVRKKKKK